MADGIVCVYCKGNLQPGAVKCRSCGEWLDGRWRLSDAGKVCLALVVVELLAMAAMSWSWVPSMRGMLADFSGPMPKLTQVVLASWWLPAWMALVLGTVASSFAFTARSRPRVTLLACALAVGLAAVIVSWWGLELPIGNLAAAIKTE